MMWEQPISISIRLSIRSFDRPPPGRPPPGRPLVWGREVGAPCNPGKPKLAEFPKGCQHIRCAAIVLRRSRNLLAFECPSIQPPARPPARPPTVRLSMLCSFVVCISGRPSKHRHPPVHPRTGLTGVREVVRMLSV